MPIFYRDDGSTAWGMIAAMVTGLIVLFAVCLFIWAQSQSQVTAAPTPSTTTIIQPAQATQPPPVAPPAAPVVIPVPVPGPAGPAGAAGTAGAPGAAGAAGPTGAPGTPAAAPESTGTPAPETGR